MSQTPSSPQPRHQQPPHKLWPYGVLVVVLLVVLSGAIMTPDYLNYKYRMAALAARTQSTNALVSTNNITSQTHAAAVGIADTNQAMQFTPSDVPLKSADIYETYGKLVTTLLGFVSVLGVLFGYFVRRSLREVEEDVRGDVDRRVAIWEKENVALVQGTQKQMERVDSQLAEFLKVKAEAERLVKVLSEVEKLENEKKTVTPSAKDVTKAINSDPSIDPAPK